MVQNLGSEVRDQRCSEQGDKKMRKYHQGGSGLHQNPGLARVCTLKEPISLGCFEAKERACERRITARRPVRKWWYETCQAD